MNISDFDFNLPDELIAQEPCTDRDRSRLMVVDRRNDSLEHRLFFEITDYLKPGDLLVINDTKVIPARLLGRKRTGGKAEVFLLEKDDKEEKKWECLVGGKRIRLGAVIEFNDALKGEVVEEVGDGRFKIRFQSDRPLDEVLEEVGRVPLPPYIKRTEKSESGLSPIVDKQRYQTVFADKKGAVAAPTAGLHFTEALLKKIKDMGVDVVRVTLHVGPGTFLPVKVENIEEHRMLPERYEISPDAAIRINKARTEGRRVIAVGSTVTRALESAANDQGAVKAGVGRTSIFIYPGYTFKVVDVIVTNFHLPKSTLIMLVSAFAGRALMLNAYREAIEQRYRFYSYGDAMLII